MVNGRVNQLPMSMKDSLAPQLPLTNSSMKSQYRFSGSSLLLGAALFAFHPISLGWHGGYPESQRTDRPDHGAVGLLPDIGPEKVGAAKFLLNRFRLTHSGDWEREGVLRHASKPVNKTFVM